MSAADRGAPWTACPLPRSFYERPTLVVARALLGCVLVHETEDGESVAGMIVEVEAYRGPKDLAAHSAKGRRTARNEVMYGEAGHAYVYFTYGMHHCVNVVTRAPEIPEAVLIRAAVPLRGEARMRARRGLDAEAPAFRLARGPGNLCRAFGIDRSRNGADLTSSTLTIRPGRRFRAAEVRSSPRIGIDYAGAYVAKPWRFFAADERAVSG